MCMWPRVWIHMRKRGQAKRERERDLENEIARERPYN